MAHVNVVNIFHKLDGIVTTYVLVESSAESIGNVVLTVREGSRTAEAAHDGADWTIDAGLNLVTVYGTFSLFQRIAGFINCYLKLWVQFHKLIGREYTSRSRTDYYNVKISVH